MSASSERRELTERLARSRKDLTDGIAELGGALNVSKRLKRSIRRRPVWWVGGGVTAGIVVARIFGRRRRRKKNDLAAPVRRSIFLGLLGIAGKQILRQTTPALQKAAREKLENWAASWFSTSRKAPAPDPDETSAESTASSPPDSHV